MTVDRGPGIRARVARVAADQVTAIYEFRIWERLTLFAYVRPQTAVRTSSDRRSGNGG